jgi:hypothetical protein
MRNCSSDFPEPGRTITLGPRGTVAHAVSSTPASAAVARPWPLVLRRRVTRRLVHQTLRPPPTLQVPRTSCSVIRRCDVRSTERTAGRLTDARLARTRVDIATSRAIHSCREGAMARAGEMHVVAVSRSAAESAIGRRERTQHARREHDHPR